MNRAWVLNCLEHIVFIEDEPCVVGSIWDTLTDPNSWFSLLCVSYCHWGWDVHRDPLPTMRMWKKGWEVPAENRVKNIWLSSCCLSLAFLMAHIDKKPTAQPGGHVSRNWKNSLDNILWTGESYQQPRECAWKWTSADPVLRCLQPWLILTATFWEAHWNI